MVAGLRLGDLCTLSPKHVGELAIVKTTGKSRGRRTIRVPIPPETRELLSVIKARQDPALGGIGCGCGKEGAPVAAKADHNSEQHALPPLDPGRSGESRDRRQGQDRGRSAPPRCPRHFATRLREAGLKASEIADVLGWDEDRVERLLAVYVDNDEIIMDIARRISKTQTPA